MTLREYIIALLVALRHCDPDAYDRLCHVVGPRSARIQLDKESAIVRMNQQELQVERDSNDGETVSGEGRTTSATVLALLDGSLEVSEAILNDAIEIKGELEQINRMFQAIEIILDASPRCPELQQLSRAFVEGRRASSVGGNSMSFGYANWYPFAVLPEERKLLARYDLLPRYAE
jgi:hypothetical protein